MGLRSSERKLSFDILSFDNNKEDDSLSLFRSISDSSHNRTKSDADISPTPKSRKKKRQKKKKPTSPSFDAIPEDVVLDSDERIGSGIRFESRSDVNCQSSSYGGSVCTVVAASGESGTSLRQRNVNGTDDLAAEESPSEKQERRSETMPNGSSGGGGGVLTKLETAESLDWKRLMAEDPHGEKASLFVLIVF